MNHRLILILLSLIGISASAMPWLIYPKSNTIFYGYIGDGVITGTLFFVILAFSINAFRKGAFSLLPSIFTIGLSGLLTIVFYNKISDFNFDKANFTTQSPELAVATAGYKLGYGVYVFGYAAIAILVIAIVVAITNKVWSKTNIVAEKQGSKKMDIAISAILLLVLSILAFNFQNFSTKEYTQDSLQPVLSKDIQQMGKALKEADFNSFINFNHPSMVESYGGRSNFIKLLEATEKSMKESGLVVKDVSLANIFDIQKDDKSVQAIITQAITLTYGLKDTTETQMLIAVSENQGNNWHYINITGKSKSEMKRFFPLLNQNLKF